MLYVEDESRGPGYGVMLKMDRNETMSWLSFSELSL